MILIIGGSYQGKTEYAKQLLQESRLEPLGDVECADGSVDCVDKAMERPVILGFHHYVRRLLEQADAESENSIEVLLDEILSVNRNVIITMDEVGYGIVPVSKSDRAYREAVGRTGQRLAKEADQVYRVLCGIGTQIK